MLAFSRVVQQSWSKRISLTLNIKNFLGLELIVRRKKGAIIASTVIDSYKMGSVLYHIQLQVIKDCHKIQKRTYQIRTRLATSCSLTAVALSSLDASSNIFCSRWSGKTPDEIFFCSHFMQCLHWHLHAGPSKSVVCDLRGVRGWDGSGEDTIARLPLSEDFLAPLEANRPTSWLAQVGFVFFRGCMKWARWWHLSVRRREMTCHSHFYIKINLNSAPTHILLPLSWDVKDREGEGKSRNSKLVHGGAWSQSGLDVTVAFHGACLGRPW